MTTTSEGQPWDFSHVLGLINTLSHNPPDHSTTPDQDEKRRDSPQETHGGPAELAMKNDGISTTDFAPPSHALGDFSKIYQYLGTPLSSPAPAVQPPQGAEHARSDAIELSSKDDYASDGATYIKSSNKNVTWNDLVSADEPVTGDASDTSVVPDSPTLTKSQRKKKNRKERKAKEAAAAAKAATVSESEADIVARKKTPASKASAHARASTPSNRYNLRPRDGSGQVARSSSTRVVDDDLSASIQTAVQRLESAKKSHTETRFAESDATPSKPPRSKPSLSRTTSHPPAPAQADGPSTNKSSGSASAAKWPVTPSKQKQATRFLPSSVQPPRQTAIPSSNMPSNVAMQPQTALSKHPRSIEPLVVRSGEDRHWALFMKLLNHFWSDRTHLINPMNLTTHNNDPKGIHVFVDASNIFIGFNDQLKRARGIPPWVQVPSVDLSFDALALLMERRRPVAKRVLAGSNPWLPAFDKAKAVGYECSILEKVYKARELTERQIYFREQDRLMGRRGAKAPPANTVATVNGGQNGSGSGSETNAPQYARPAMIEQGVDEILHLKILESIVDTDEPATIVLATGDAAQAEYSQGFMAMAERALKKGWSVELVSWSKNISAMYTRKAWMDAWGEKFKVIFLDDYAEELLAM